MMVVSPKQKGRWKAVPPVLTSELPIRIPVGGSQKVTMKVSRGKALVKNAKLELDDPPAGLHLRDMKMGAGTLTFTLAVDADATESFSGNVIVSIIREFTPKAREGRPTPKKRRRRIGYLPAIPVEIIAK